MKRSIVLYVILIGFFAAMVLGVVYLNNPAFFTPSKPNDDNSGVNIELVKYSVSSGQIVHSYMVDGQVISQRPEVYIDRVTVENITDDNFEMLRSKGEILEPGESHYVYKGVNRSLEFNAQVIGIGYCVEESKRIAAIDLLNYDKLFIVAEISAEQLSSISYDTIVDVKIGSETYSSSIIEIGYEIVDGQTGVCVKLPTTALPGTVVKLQFILDVVDKGLYVPAEAVYQDGDLYYANVFVDGIVQQRQLMVGQFFSVVEEGIQREYVEILSGAKENDVLVVEQVSISGDRIKELIEDD